APLPLPPYPRRLAGGGEAAEEPDGRAVQCRMTTTDRRVAQVLAGALHRLEPAGDGRAVPAPSFADAVGVELRRPQRLVVTGEVPHRRGVQAGVFALDRAAVQRLVLAVA